MFGQTAPAERVTLPRLDLGPMHAADLSVLAADLASVGQRLGTRLDAIVGLDVLPGTLLPDRLPVAQTRLELLRDRWRWYHRLRSAVAVPGGIRHHRWPRGQVVRRHRFRCPGSIRRAAPERAGGGEAIVPADSLLTSLSSCGVSSPTASSLEAGTPMGGCLRGARGSADLGTMCPRRAATGIARPDGSLTDGRQLGGRRGLTIDESDLVIGLLIDDSDD